VAPPGCATLRSPPAAGAPLTASTDPSASFTARTWITALHLRHFIRTVLPATFSSAIWYFALHLWQLNLIRLRETAAQTRTN